ncbi:hypothetical protein [Sulfurisphaera ohwakuensis]|uniref:VapB-type antitoxin n=1 Tax=Sulfurisphaera ohwakuensis TaxID=69656 RepID=A0A650CFV3_SULOH|nr:hypothetical protein [Sulfurisphaera ohwakuensis]MBB5255288.1 hypothetical protein [Sulfurisphaera ohwakuensis]QGR16618.1 hypothetical protein D1869_05000 [Sulfurisphaera ohwakuensis]
METRKADDKGRVYLGNDYAGKNLYVVRVFGGLLLLDNEKKAKEIEERKDEFLRKGIEELLEFLGEPSVEEIKEVVEKSRRRRFS